MSEQRIYINDDFVDFDAVFASRNEIKMVSTFSSCLFTHGITSEPSFGISTRRFLGVFFH